MITFAKEFEPNVLSTFFSSVLKAKNFTKNVWAYNKCFRDSEILQVLKDNFYYKIYFTFDVAPEKLRKTNSNNNRQKNHHTY